MARARRITEPQPAGRRRIVQAPVTFSEENGVRYLHFGTEWIQGAMRLRKPDAIELEYVKQMMVWMLFMDPPARIAQLGLGAAALAKFCYRQFPASHVTAIELNSEVIAAAHSMFRLPPEDERLSVLNLDAWEFVSDSRQHGRYGALQVDLYDAAARGPVLDSPEFYAHCRACLTGPGVLTVNLFGESGSFGRNMRALNHAFEGRVIALPEVDEGNRIAIAFNGPLLEASLFDLYERAVALEQANGLPVQSWVSLVKAEAGRFIVSSDERARLRI